MRRNNVRKHPKLGAHLLEYLELLSAVRDTLTTDDFRTTLPAEALDLLDVGWTDLDSLERLLRQFAAEFLTLSFEDGMDSESIGWPAVSIRQPWAELLINGRKSIEIRSWAAEYRGRLWLHTGVKSDPELERKFGLNDCTEVDSWDASS